MIDEFDPRLYPYITDDKVVRPRRGGGFSRTLKILAVAALVVAVWYYLVK